MTFEVLGSDFYGYQNSLSDQEKSALANIRAYLDSDVRPIVNGCWERAEFPTEVIKPLARLGVYSFGWEETKPFQNSAVPGSKTTPESATPKSVGPPARRCSFDSVGFSETRSL